MKFRGLVLSAALILLTACGGGSGPNDDEPSIQEDAPIEPESGKEKPEPEPSLGFTINLKGVVYNNAEIEIFWDRSSAAAAAGVVAYRIERNGEVLVSARDGLSYYDGSVEPNTGYTYEVTPLGANDSFGTASQIILETPPYAPEIPPANVTEVFTYLIGLSSPEEISRLLGVPSPEQGGMKTTEGNPSV